ncbi:MAG: hypothetical protein IPM95_10130 [Sphingobacteriales bacterium]|nr:hypothetical protein [Sphingobacteriales bacterium]
MKKLISSAVLVLSSIFIFAQQPLDNGAVSGKEPLKLRIRKNVIRPLGKDWYVTFSAGYGMPFLSTNKRSPLKEIGDKDWYQKNGELSVKPLFGTNGGGFAFNLGWGHMFNKYIGIDVLHTVAWHPEQLDARIDLDTYYATQKTGTLGIYISPHLIMRWDNGKRFGITGKAGLVLPIFGQTQSRAYILDKQGRIIETLGGYPVIPLAIPGLIGLEIELSANAHTSYKPTVGVSASIGFDVKLSKRVTLFAEARVQAYTITLKETIFDEFRQTSSINVLGIKIPAPDGLLVIPSNVNSAAEAPEFLKHYVYKSEITKESNTARYGFKEIINLDPNIPEVDINKPRDEPGQKFNASTMYFNAGLRIDFDLMAKKREAQRDGTSSKKNKR